MKTKDKYGIDWGLMASYLSGNASVTGKSEIQAWIDSSEKNKEIFQHVEKLWKSSENAGLAQIDVENAWDIVNAKAHIVPKYSARYLLVKSYKYSLRIAAVLLLGLFSWYVFSYVMSNKNVNSGSEIVVLSLSDGSQVTLNKETRLKYPRSFKGNSREVYLEGEAFFNIVRNPQKPFIIKTAGSQIKVLGTSFNVNTKCRGNVEVVVNSGVVSFMGDSSKRQIMLHKNDKGVLMKATGLIEKSVNSDPNIISWKTRKFIFHETRLKDIFENIGKVYDVKIVAKDSAIYNCKMTATFEKLEIDDIIKSIELAFKYKSFKNDNVYTITGNDCTQKH
jgi:transmembrane sensor